MVDLPAARFADETDHLAAPQLQRHVIDQNWPVASIRAHRNPHVANVQDDGIVL